MSRANTVIISKKEYRKLLACEALMDRLDAAGVDNWEGYDIAKGSEYDFSGLGYSYSEEVEKIDEEYKDE